MKAIIPKMLNTATPTAGPTGLKLKNKRNGAIK